ncbi:hypothetical protein C8R45DRAFT_1075450 [Mycena sanguinolenta]|nr:hypothetical protein C8R45DRAFT_1075450 [Mycena sanguinolenta]
MFIACPSRTIICPWLDVFKCNLRSLASLAHNASQVSEPQDIEDCWRDSFLLLLGNTMMGWKSHIRYRRCSVKEQESSVRLPIPAFRPAVRITIMDMDSTLGAIEIGTLLSGVLFGLITAQTYVYFKSFPNDARFTKGLVLGLWIVELAHTACIFDALYMYTIKSYGDPTSLIKFPIALDVTILLHGATVIIGRMSKFLQNKLWIPLIAAGILIVRFVVFVVTGAAATMMSSLGGFMQQWMPLILFDILSCAITDVVISAILVYQLAIRRRTAYKSTLAMMDKLIMWSVETCLVTTITTIVMLVCFLTMKQNFIWVGILLVQPKIFSNALLANLNSRTSLRNADSEVHEFTPNSNIRFKRPTGTGVLVTQSSATIKDDLKTSPTPVDVTFHGHDSDSRNYSLVPEGLSPSSSTFQKVKLQSTLCGVDSESAAVITTLKTELGSVQERLRKALEEQKELKEEVRVQKKRVLEETLARAQDGFTFKVKIDALFVEISRLTSLVERNMGRKAPAPPQKQTKFQLEQELTYEQKKDLACEIPQLSGSKLEKVIEIIGRVYPVVQEEQLRKTLEEQKELKKEIPVQKTKLDAIVGHSQLANVLEPNGERKLMQPLQVLTFQQKKEMGDKINQLCESRLKKVLEIIARVCPDVQNLNLGSVLKPPQPSAELRQVAKFMRLTSKFKLSTLPVIESAHSRRRAKQNFGTRHSRTTTRVSSAAGLAEIAALVENSLKARNRPGETSQVPGALQELEEELRVQQTKIHALLVQLKSVRMEREDHNCRAVAASPEEAKA